MQASADDRIDSLERRVDQGFADTRIQIRTCESELRKEIAALGSETRADYRTLVAVVFGLWATTVLGFVGVLVNLH